MEKAFIQCQKIFFRFNESWPIWLAPMVIICFLVCLLHLLDRQVELSIRSDFLWQYKLSSEEEGVDTMRGINKILLENILPAHVAEHYLLRGQGMSGILQDNVIIQKKVWNCFRKLWFSLQDCYSERYENIAVMFASIPNYKEFYDENDVNKQGLECLRLLNEIICDFDKVRFFVCFAFALSPEGGNWKKLDCGRKFCGRASSRAARPFWKVLALSSFCLSSYFPSQSSAF